MPCSLQLLAHCGTHGQLPENAMALLHCGQRSRRKCPIVGLFPNGRTTMVSQQLPSYLTSGRQRPNQYLMIVPGRGNVELVELRHGCCKCRPCFAPTPFRPWPIMQSQWLQSCNLLIDHAWLCCLRRTCPNYMCVAWLPAPTWPTAYFPDPQPASRTLYKDQITSIHSTGNACEIGCA